MFCAIPIVREVVPTDVNIRVRMRPTAVRERRSWAARRLARELDGHRAYAGAKLALLRWTRRHAPGPGWAAAGIRLNAVAPGPVRTPLLEDSLTHPLTGLPSATSRSRSAASVLRKMSPPPW